MRRRFKKMQRGAGLLALLASGLIFWAPLQTASHRLTVPHAWCETHGHLIELIPGDPGPRRAPSSRPGDVLGERPAERAEVACSAMTHERRPAALSTESTKVSPHPITVARGWAAPELAHRCLDCAPKQGPPTGR